MKYLPILVFLKRVLNYSPFVIPVFLLIRNPIFFFKGYFGDKEGVITFWSGLKLTVYNKDDISSISVIFLKKQYGKIEESVKTVFDIGANRGYFSLLAAESPQVTVYSFEPIPETFKSFEKNIKVNEIKNIKAFNLGVAGKTSKNTFYFADNKSIVSSMVFQDEMKSKKVDIDCISLADVFSKNNIKSVDLMKIDCEGAEFDIFYSSSNDTLKKINEIRMEYHNNLDIVQNNIENLSVYLEKNGFTRTKYSPDNDFVGIAWFKNFYK